MDKIKRKEPEDDPIVEFLIPTPREETLNQKIKQQLKWYEDNKDNNTELNRDYAAMLTNLNK